MECLNSYPGTSYGGLQLEVAQAKATWEAILGDLQVQVARPIYETWLKETEAAGLSDEVLRVRVPTLFAVEWLERRMYQLIQSTVYRVTGRPLRVQFEVRGSGTEEEEKKEKEIAPSNPPGIGPKASQTSMHQLNGRYTFDNFVVGSSNHLPYSAARAVTEDPGHSYNPLFIYSGVGLGKTHLLHAIAHSCRSKHMAFLYVTSEQFTNDFISAIRTKSTEDFRLKYRSADVLLVDDIQFISGKEQTQEGFFHTFNDLHNSNRQVVLASDRPPKALSLLEDRLRSRLGWGLIADIQPPDLETRMAIIRTKADQMNVELVDQVIEYLSKKVQKNVRDLEGSLNKMVALSRLTDSPITLDLASQAISDLVQERPTRSVQPGTILEEVAARFGVSGEDLIGTSRRKEIVRARHAAIYLLHQELGMKATDIGRLLGGRNHSTIIHAMGRMNSEINLDPHLRQDVLAVKETIFQVDTRS